MFGKPEWFRESAKGLKLAPVSWRGWAYMGAWTALLLLPTLALLIQGKPFETLIWLLASGGLGAWDLKTLRGRIAGKPKESKEDDVLVIDENETESARFATRHFDLRVRNR